MSESKNLYTDIIEPIGYKAKEHNNQFLMEKAKVTNLLTKTFIDDFCDKAGAIQWPKLVRRTSGNYDLDKFFPQ